MKTTQVCIAILVVMATVTPHVYANGINPPPPTGGTILVASCVDRATNATTVLHRVRVLTDNSAGMVQFRIPPATTTKLKLSDIRRLEIQSTTTSADGFATAEVDLLKPKFRGTAAVRLGKGATALRLSGFNEDRERVNLDVSACLVLEIQGRPAAGEDVPKAVPKK